MIPFEKFYYLQESFRKSKKVKHLYDVPMFSIFAHNDLIWSDQFKHPMDVNIELDTKRVRNVFAEARKRINKMGFPSMHVNVVFKDLSKEVNRNTGGGVGGYAHRSGKYMSIDYDHFLDGSGDWPIRVIVHEWAHLWMFNNSKGFKKAVQEYYQKIRQGENIPTSYNREKLYQEPGNLSDFGYSHEDDHEMWDTMGRFIRNHIDSAYQIKHNIAFPDPENTWWGSKPFNIEDSISIIEDCITWILKKKLKIKEDIKKHDNFIKKSATIAGKRIYPIINDATNRIVESELYIKKSNEQWNENEPFDDPDEKIKNIYEDNDIFNDIQMYIYYTVIKILGTFKINRHDTYLSGKEYADDRTNIKNLVKWVDDYGMSNDDELWATGIEYFIKLEPEHKRAIMKLMGTQGNRTTPNRRMREHKWEQLKKITIDDFDSSKWK